MTKKKNTENNDELLTVPAAATERGVSRARIYQWINEGRLAKHKKYGLTLVSRKELHEVEARQGGWPKGKPRKVESEVPASKKKTNDKGVRKRK